MVEQRKEESLLRNVQRCEIFLRKVIFLVSPLMKVHTAVVRASLAAKECHAVLRRPVTCPHYISSASRRGCTIDSTNASRGVLPPVVGDVESDDRILTICGCALDDHNLGYFPVLAEIVVGTQRWNQLGNSVSYEVMYS